MKDLEGFEGRWTALAPAPERRFTTRWITGCSARRLPGTLGTWRIEQSWKRNPEFYVDQTLGSVYLLLLPPPPFAEARQAEIVARVKQIPVTLQAARENLTDMRQPFVQLGIDGLDHVADRLDRMEKGLAPQLTAANQQALHKALPAAVTALTEYRGWLVSQLPSAHKDTAIGRDNYVFFLLRSR